MKNEKLKIKNIFVFIIVLLFLVVIVLFYHQHRLFNKAMELEKEGKKIFAIDYYGYVIIAYVPYSPYIKKAEHKILEFGKSFEKNNELYKALFAYEILRSSYFQVRSFYQPRQNLIDKLNYKIAEIKVKILKNENRLEDEKKEYKRQLKILQHTDFPSTFGSLILCLSFFGWVGSIIFMILKGFEEDKTDKKVIFLTWISYSIFFTLWIFLLFSKI